MGPAREKTDVKFREYARMLQYQYLHIMKVIKLTNSFVFVSGRSKYLLKHTHHHLVVCKVYIYMCCTAEAKMILFLWSDI
jgi:hypothetical protein